MTDPDALLGRAGTAMKIYNAVIAAVCDAGDPVRVPRQRTPRMAIHLPVNERKPTGPTERLLPTHGWYSFVERVMAVRRQPTPTVFLWAEPGMVDGPRLEAPSPRVVRGRARRTPRGRRSWITPCSRAPRFRPPALKVATMHPYWSVVMGS